MTQLARQERALLHREDIPALALGAGVLGAGGGGSTHLAEKWLRTLMAAGDSVAMMECGQDAWLYPVGIVGAVSVLAEALPAGHEMSRAIDRMVELTGKAPGGVLPLEIGGQNGVVTAIAAHAHGLPLVDGDLMGRAMPGLHQFSNAVTELPVSPAVLHWASGATLILEGTDAAQNERILRAAMAHSGGWAALCLPPLNGRYDQGGIIKGSVTRALQIGALMKRVQAGIDTLAEATSLLGGVVLGAGRIVDISRLAIANSFGPSTAITIQLSQAPESTIRVDMGSEFLVAIKDGVVVATCPDIICLFEVRSSAPLTGDTVRQGLEVTSVVLPAAAFWAQGMYADTVGPRGFGMDIEPVMLPQMGSKNQEATQ